jgi:phage-related protein
VARRPRKQVAWRGDAKDVVHEWPKQAKCKLGLELTRVELGANPHDGEALTDVGAGVQCIRIASNGNAYRVVYVASFGDRVYVLHAFQKKSKRGSETPQEEKEKARRRYKELCEEILAAQKPSRRSH